jgi:sugar O-acyltransferase (sialic acid O-acetyltransferase NeuD family)
VNAPGQIVIFGAGGHAKVIADLALCLGYEVLGFLDDVNPSPRQVMGKPVLGASSWLRSAGKAVQVALAIGDNRARFTSFETCHDLGLTCAVLVHPRAAVASSAHVGEGTVVLAGAVVNAEAHLGRGVIVNSGAIAEHECTVADFAHLSPNATLGGRVKIGAKAHIGLGACVLPGLEVGERSTLGAGAVAHRTIPPGVVAVGVPARVIKSS